MDTKQLRAGLSATIHCLFGGGGRSGRGGILSGILSALTLFAAVTLVSAADTREIELTDGSVIAGEIVSLSGGMYTVRTATLGTLRIEASKIRVIRLQGSSASGSARDQTKSIENQMIGDKDIMAIVLSLQNDPDMQNILQNPEIMKAVQAGDLDALMRNPEFMKLMDKQAVQDISRKLSR